MHICFRTFHRRIPCHPPRESGDVLENTSQNLISTGLSHREATPSINARLHFAMQFLSFQRLLLKVRNICIATHDTMIFFYSMCAEHRNSHERNRRFPATMKYPSSMTARIAGTRFRRNHPNRPGVEPHRAMKRRTASAPERTLPEHSMS